MKNRMVSDETRAAYSEQAGGAYPERRHSGMTTAVVLSHIAEAMTNPGEIIPILVRGSEHKDTLIHLIKARLRQMELDHFKVGPNSITYDIFGGE